MEEQRRGQSGGIPDQYSASGTGWRDSIHAGGRYGRNRRWRTATADPGERADPYIGKTAGRAGKSAEKEKCGKEGCHYFL